MAALSPPPRHEIVWQLASACRRHADALVPLLTTHRDAAALEYRRDVLTAIALLKGVLTDSAAHDAVPSSEPGAGGLSTAVEARTRYMLARLYLEHTENGDEAAAQARRIIHLTRGISGMDALRMGAYEVQAKVQLRQCQLRMARTSVREAQKEAERLGLHGWYYHFIITQLKLLAEDAASKGRQMFTAMFSVLADTVDYARGHGHRDAQTFFLLMRAQYGLLADDARTAKQALDEAAQCLADDALDDTEQPGDLSAMTCMARPHSGTSISHARHLWLRILYGVHYGDAKSALASLQQLQDILNWWTLPRVS
ncbi:hypothetical protein SYNPS1DRAFT_24877 [Syncephalis pseudoplumigaleata]|uniref:Cohesin loading factor-domain-containing protein n=1 Tax=Syncephalis pseudoplumigaleata TaxID=1712513 RepID=A0A4V1J0Y1_9FUNG|nr:hypothetical protein SYNPS1DRAFT_24877 [Syncephalis pseudoplumigaleata]|eukprot:RKP23139.1 hypothetical protein SYNPS1DRAFT_24877 [Syncephalis pseudoplumigaleata]